MSIPGYKRKTKAATWLSAFPVVLVIRAQPVKPRRRVRAYRRIRKVSVKRAKVYAEVYLPMRAQFLAEHPKCAVFPAKASEDVHHIYGRHGKLLTWKPGFLAVSRVGHEYIQYHQREAQAKGWLAKPGEWGKQPSKE